MNFQVFGCPNCQQPFQVAQSQSGQLVQCPSCAQTVEIPASSQVAPPPAEQLAFTCPQCNGQFGITNDMYGHHVGCPHCQSSVLVQKPSAQNVDVDVPTIVTTESTKKRKAKTSQRWKSHSKSKKSDQVNVAAPTKTNQNRLESNPIEGRKPLSPEQPVQPVQPVQAIQAIRRSPPSVQPTATDVAAPPGRGLTDDDEIDRDLLPPTGKRQAKPKPPDGPPSPTPAAKSKPADSSPGLSSEDKKTVRSTVSREKEKSNVVDEVAVVQSEFQSSQSGKPDSGSQNGLTGSGEAKAANASPPDSHPGVPDQSQPAEPIDHLLPPKFEVIDPSRMRSDFGKHQFKVVLPDGHGGTRQVDNRVIRVEHGGEQVALVALTEKEKRRRRVIQNTIAIVIGIIIIAIAFSLLR